MSEKEIKDYLDWIGDLESCNLWEIESAFDNKKDFETLTKILGERPAKFMRGLIKHIVFALFTWHNEKDEESHIDIRNTIDKLRAQFRNHRHDTSTTFSGKAEY